MEDRFKFRVFVKSLKKMYDWDELLLNKNENNVVEFYGDNMSFLRYSLEDILNDNNLILMQCTGIKDKNGKLIYEGDVLNDDIGDMLEVKFGELPLNKSGDCVCRYKAFYCKNYGQLGKEPFFECQNISEWMSIIGNIYENPELLNKTETK